MGKPEGAVEDYFIRRTEEYGCMCMKFTSPSKTGMPDRIIVGHGKTVFVELKAPGEKPRPRQIVVIKELRDHGALVYVTDSKPGVDALLRELFPGKVMGCAKRACLSNPTGPSAVFVDLLQPG